MKPWVLIPWIPGTNCHHETATAFEKAGAKAVVQPLQVLSERSDLWKCDLFALAGGFSWGDHFGSGRIAALDFAKRFGDQMQRIIERRVPILGICNGFQTLVNLGALPGIGQRLGPPQAALDFNLSGHFEYRHDVRLFIKQPTGIDCVWTRKLAGREISLPSAHGEGRSVFVDGVAPNVIATYGTKKGDDSYGASPNGSHIAGLCDDSGLTAGMMPHPERRCDELHGGSDGLLIFQSGVEAVR